MPTDITSYNAEGQAHGLWELYYDNGNLSYKGTYINGLRHGYWERYWPNGKFGLVTNYLNGKVGLYIAYHSSGVLAEKKFYAN